MYDKYKVNLPIGISNNWSIEQFEVTEHPDMELENCEVKRYNGGMGIIQAVDKKIVDMFVPYHNLNALSWIKEIESDEDST